MCLLSTHSQISPNRREHQLWAWPCLTPPSVFVFCISVTNPHCLALQTYELKEKTGLSGAISSLWEKLNQPFQPGVPEPQNPRTRVLSLPFNRKKLHLWVCLKRQTYTYTLLNSTLHNKQIPLLTVFLSFSYSQIWHQV